MNTDENNQGGTADDTSGGEGESNSSSVTLTREEYDKIQKDLGSTKRELKDLKKPKEETKEAPKENSKPDEVLSQKYERLAIKQAGITHVDDIALAQKLAKETNKDIEEVLESRYFKVELEAQQTSRTNIEATSNVKGNSTGNSSKAAKESADYWLGQDRPPMPSDIPDSKLRREIVQKMIMAKRNNKTLKFYNE